MTEFNELFRFRLALRLQAAGSAASAPCVEGMAVSDSADFEPKFEVTLKFKTTRLDSESIGVDEIKTKCTAEDLRLDLVGDHTGDAVKEFARKVMWSHYLGDEKREHMAVFELVSGTAVLPQIRHDTTIPKGVHKLLVLIADHPPLWEFVGG